MVTNYHGVRATVSNRITRQLMNWKKKRKENDMELFSDPVLNHRSFFVYKLVNFLTHFITNISQYSGKRHKDWKEDDWWKHFWITGFWGIFLLPTLLVFHKYRNKSWLTCILCKTLLTVHYIYYLIYFTWLLVYQFLISIFWDY